MSKIEQQVMAGVAVVYSVRRLTSRTALQCYALFACAFSTTLLVSLPHVLQNFLRVEEGGLPALGTFVVAAMAHTSHVVQLFVVLGVAVFAWLLVDAARAWRMPQLRIA